MCAVLTVSRKERDKQIRRTDILRAAERIFSLKGYHEATIQDIAAEAQYATGTVYLYFVDKEALYFSLVEEKISSLMSAVKEKAEQVSDARQKIDLFIQEKLAFFEKNQDFFRIFAFERSTVMLTFDQKMSKSSRFIEHREYLTTLMKSAQEQGVVRKDCEPRQLADILISVSTAVILGWLKREIGKEKSLQEFSYLIMDMFLNGARNQ